MNFLDGEKLLFQIGRQTNQTKFMRDWIFINETFLFKSKLELVEFGIFEGKISIKLKIKLRFFKLLSFWRKKIKILVW